MNKIYRFTKKGIKSCINKTTLSVFNKKRKYKLAFPTNSGKYNAFWIRDTVMMAESGFFNKKMLLDYILLIANSEQDEDRRLLNGLQIPKGSIPDHIRFDGKSVFFPGTNECGEFQGEGKNGFLPPIDDNYYFIILVCIYIKKTKDYKILDKKVRDKTIKERIYLAFNADKSGEDLVKISSEKFAIDWGFNDTVIKSGYSLFASLLKIKCCYLLNEILFDEYYKNLYFCLSKKVEEVFYDKKRKLLYSATKTGRVFDIYASSFALTYPFNFSFSNEVSKELLRLYNLGDIVNNGYVKNVSKEDYFSSESLWEKTLSKFNTYQNGGYWAVGTGLLALALAVTDIKSANKLLNEFYEFSFKENTCYEWINKEKKDCVNYGASYSYPYIAYKLINKK